MTSTTDNMTDMTDTTDKPMRIALAKARGQTPRHIAWFIPLNEVGLMQAAFAIQDVFPRPYPKLDGEMRHDDGYGILRLNLDYLPKLVDAVPHAELSDAAKQELKLRRLPPVPEDFTIPGLKETTTLFPFQREDIWRAVNADTAFMLLSSMGSGKTIQALCTASYLNSYPALVICPATVKDVWAIEVAKHFDPAPSVQVIGGSRDERSAQIQRPADIKVINFESMRLHPELAEQEWKMIVVDEGHRCGNPRAKTTRALHRLDADYKLLLSGTPSRNGKYEELWSMLKFGWPTHWMSYQGFIERYTSRLGDNWIIGFRNVAEIQRFLKRHAARRRKEDILPDLPPITEAIQWLEFSSEQQNIYDRLKTSFILELEREHGPNEAIEVRSILPRLTRLRQLCFSPQLYGGTGPSTKLTEIKQTVQEIIENGHKVVIFSQWAKAARLIEHELKDLGGICYVDGSVPVEHRAHEIKRFQEEDLFQIYVGTYGANKEGITLTAASYVILADEPWVPADILQAVARCHRIGQLNNVHVIVMRMKDSIEERVAAKLGFKEYMVNQIVDGGEAVLPQRMTIRDIKDIL